MRSQFVFEKPRVNSDKAQKEMKTRSKSRTSMSVLYGKSKELPVAELPTARDILLYGLLLQEREENLRGTPLFNQLAEDLMIQWGKASSCFVAPVTISDNGVLFKLKNLWNDASTHARNRLSKKKVTSFTEKLDKLFDILSCKCLIYSCSDAKCPDEQCAIQAHISCECPKASKIPAIELSFIKDQRDKIGSKGQKQIGLKDQVAETEHRKREQRRLRGLKGREKETFVHMMESRSTSESDSSEESTFEVAQSTRATRKNYQTLNKAALASIR